MFYGIYLLIQANRSRLINKKEIFRGTGILGIGGGLLFLLMQIGVFFSEDFFLFYFSGGIVMAFLAVFYFYYWEKNLVNLKKIPTIIMVFNFLIFLITIILLLLFKISVSIYISLIEIFTIILGLLGSSFLLIFVFLFTIRVKGALRNKGVILIIGGILFFLGQFMDHPPGLFLFPDLFIILTPLVFIVSFGFIFYGTKGISENVSSYYNQVNICLVHRGKLLREDLIYYCPNCSMVYCQNCYELVIKQDRCWNCGERGKKTQKIKCIKDNCD
ncbi:hypothetical protein LCGC14_2749990 [marine sediment metagenome]|uniref:Uncharacterized protein n=1 Tax=marine sediment metagenome TaxID=412755 RepID=A0A0F9BAN7_9ZZZZ